MNCRLEGGGPVIAAPLLQPYYADFNSDELALGALSLLPGQLLICVNANCGH